MNARVKKSRPTPPPAQTLSAYLVELERRAERLCAKGDIKACCMLHLIDLKRAGHSPTRTELDIPATQEGMRRVVPLMLSRSVTSSSAGW